jgi:hypothetical protein
MPKDMQQLMRLSFLARVINPYFWQTLIRRKFASRTPEVLTLDAGHDPLRPKPIHP